MRAEVLRELIKVNRTGTKGQDQPGGCTGQHQAGQDSPVDTGWHRTGRIATASTLMRLGPLSLVADNLSGVSLSRGL